MSVDEDTELRDLITQTLEANGCFAKIRAQLRASIYLALEEDAAEKRSMLNNKLKSTLETRNGKIMFQLIREVLQYYDLDYTLSVYDPESCYGSYYSNEEREKIVEDLNVPDLNSNSTPLLLQLIQTLRSQEVEFKFEISGKTEVQNSNDRMKNTQVNRTFDNSNEINGNKTFDVNSPMFSVTKQNDKLEEISSDISNASPSSKDTSSSSGRSFKINKTFDVNSPVLENKPIGKQNDKSEETSTETNNASPSSKDTSSSSGRSLKISVMNVSNDPDKKSSDQQVDLEVSPPIVKDGKYSKFDSTGDKSKLSQKIDKANKARGNLSSLGDLPPLTAGKSRSNDMLLPPLYTKEFKDMNSQKELEKMFDLESLDNYEEDFMSESELDLVMNKGDGSSKNSLLDNYSVPKGDDKKPMDETNKEKIGGSTVSSVVSDDFELNSNVDDILNSC